MNKTEWASPAYGYNYSPGSASLEIAIDSAAKFEDTDSFHWA